MKFSIITCTYNSARFLADNIRSVSAQSYLDFEHIFIDGKSSDRTREILEDYRCRFPDRVKIFSLPPQGIAQAMNYGILRASGDYLIHLHADDAFYDPRVLQDVSIFLQEKNYPDWIFGREKHVRSRVGQDSRDLGLYPRFRIHTADSRSCFGRYFLGLVNYIPHQTVFIKKSIFMEQGLFRENLRCVMDVEMWLRIKDKTRWLFFDRIIARYRQHADAQSSGPKNQAFNQRESFQIHREYLGRLSFGLFVILDFILKIKNKSKRF